MRISLFLYMKNKKLYSINKKLGCIEIYLILSLKVSYITIKQNPFNEQKFIERIFYINLFSFSGMLLINVNMTNGITKIEE